MGSVKTIAVVLVILLIVGVAVWFGYLKKKLAGSSAASLFPGANGLTVSPSGVVSNNGQVYGKDLKDGTFVTPGGAIYDYQFNYQGQADSATTQAAQIATGSTITIAMPGTVTTAPIDSTQYYYSIPG